MSNNWRTVPLRDLGKWSGGGTPSKANSAFWENGTIPWVSPKDMKCDRILSADDLITEAAVKQSTTNLVPAGSVLMVTRSGILRHTFPVAVTEVPVTLNQDLKALTPAPGVLPKYVLFALKAFNREILHICSKQGTTVNSIETEKLLSFKIPLAPPERQAEIVAEIEKQLSRLDEAVTALKRIQANLKRYKAAVLKAAVEGKLTERWRKEHPDAEPADHLLKRILAERRAKWEESVGAKQGVSASPGFGNRASKGEAGETFASPLPQMKAKGLKPKDDSWKKKYKEPAGPDTANLPELPKGWVYATAEQLTDETRAITYGVIKLGDHIDGGVPILRSSDVRKLKIDYEGIKTISPDIAGQYRRTFLNGGEVVMTVRGTLGGVAVVPSMCQGFNVSREVAMLALVEPKMAYSVAFFIASSPGESWLLRRTKGIAYTGINIETLKALPIPVAPLQEQNQIIAEIDRRLSVTEELEATIETNLKRAERLRQTILQQAFSGGGPS